MALHLPRREPGRARPNARRPRSAGGRAADAADRALPQSARRAGAELSDPADVPGAAHLAERLAETRDRGHSVWIEPDRGVDIALLPMLRAVVGDRVLPSRARRSTRGRRLPAARRKRPARAAVQGAAASAVPGHGGSVAGLRRVRPRDHGEGPGRVRDRRAGRGAGPRPGDRGAVSAAGPPLTTDHPAGDRRPRLQGRGRLRRAHHGGGLAGVPRVRRR